MLVIGALVSLCNVICSSSLSTSVTITLFYSTAQMIEFTGEASKFSMMAGTLDSIGRGLGGIVHSRFEVVLPELGPNHIEACTAQPGDSSLWAVSANKLHT